MPVRTADAQWEGSLEDGKGTMRMSAWEGPTRSYPGSRRALEPTPRS